MKKITLLLLFVLTVIIQSRAHVQLLNPLGGETLNPGNALSIQWREVQTHEPLNWDILFSSDGGLTWDTVKSNIPINTTTYSWLIPETETLKGQIKIVQDNVDVDYEDISENFVISSVTGIYTPIESNKINIYPNPLIDFLTIEYDNPGHESFTLTLYNTRGQLVRTITDISTNNIQIERKNLSIGLYFFQLNTRSEIYSVGNFIIQ
jgi:hypothetical protein